MFKKEDIIKYHFPDFVDEKDLAEHKRVNLIATIIKNFCEEYSVGPFGDFHIFSRAEIIMKMVFGHKRVFLLNTTTIYTAVLHLLLVKHMINVGESSHKAFETFMRESELSVLYNMANNSPNIIGVFYAPRRAMRLEAINKLGGKFLGGYCLVSTGTYQEKEIQISNLIDILIEYLLEGRQDIYKFGMENPDLFTFEKFSSLFNKQ